MMNMISVIIGTIFYPKKTFEKLLVDPERIKKAWMILLWLQIAYTPMLILFQVFKIYPWYPLFLIIPPHFYWIYQIFACVPLSIACLFIANGLLQFLTRNFIKDTKVIRSYEDVFAVLTFLFTVPSFFICFCDYILLILFLVQHITKPLPWMLVFNLSYPILVFIWCFILLNIAIRICQPVTKPVCFLLSFITLVVFFSFLIVFLF